MINRLPLDISSFRKLREKKYLYVDKTKYAYDLIMGGERYFLSRPRRFGKSLFVSMLNELLRGNKELFKGLWIESSGYQFQKYGVIDLDLSSFGIDNVQSFKEGLCFELSQIADDYSLKIALNKENPELALRGLVKALRKEHKNIAILIDEYDYPILKTLSNQEKAREIRDSIRSFFASIKSLDEEVDFVFITGVSSFAKAGLFSGMNNLRIITLNERYANICGYNDDEIESNFKESIQAWADKDNISYKEMRSKIREWYNGYHFGANTASVYNPFSIMNAIEAQEFKNFWFLSGTPTFLVDLANEYKKEGIQSLEPEKVKITEDTLGIFEVGSTPLPALMFQSGYLTIKDYDKTARFYSLGYPNLEVKTALQKLLLGTLTSLDPSLIDKLSYELKEALNIKNIEVLISLIKQVFTQVAYQEQMKSEKFYHALLQVLFSACGIRTQSEIPISHGRVDLSLHLPQLIYLIEVKFNEPAQDALDQIKDRKYWEAFLQENKPIVLLGIAFERKTKVFNITSAYELVK